MAGVTRSGDPERFERVRRLGEGGMGVVYEAIDRRTGERVALKGLRAMSPRALRLFKKEFRSLHDIRHPNLVTLHELIEQDGEWFIIMDLFDGVDLVSYVRSPKVRFNMEHDPTLDLESLPPAARARHESAITLVDAAPFVVAEALTLDGQARLKSALQQLAEGLAFLHGSGKVHRDIKPDNVIVDATDQLRILDFGLVTDQLVDRSASASGLWGTVDYMSPEQAAAGSVTGASDMYATGVILYELLTGRLPFDGTPLQILSAKATRDPARPKTLQPDVPAELDALCVELLSRSPGQRPTPRQVIARLGGAPAPAVIEAPAAPRQDAFVGREYETNLLAEAVDRPGTRLFLVEGESGIGKSALLAAFSAQVAGEALLLRGRCIEREAVPFKALDAVMDRLSIFFNKLDGDSRKEFSRDLVLVAQMFPVFSRSETLPTLTKDPREARRQAFAALRRIFLRLGQKRRLIVTIEDLQWADEDSLLLLDELVRPPDAATMLVVATIRSTKGGDTPSSAVSTFFARAARRLPLGPLPKRDAEELAGMLLATAGGGAATSHEIAKEAGGNPLFIRELSVRRGPAHGPAASEASAAKGALDDLLWSRVAALAPDPLRVLEVLAVAGTPIPVDVIGRSAGIDANAAQAAIHILRREHIAHCFERAGRDVVEVQYDRLRAAVQSRLSPDRLREVHKSLALALGTVAKIDPETLLVHWRGAGDLARATSLALRAAARAEAALAFEQAARLYGAALEMHPEAMAYGLGERLGNALEMAGRGPAAAKAYLASAARVSEKNPDAALELRRRASEQLLCSGRIDEGVAQLESAALAVGLSLPSRSVVVPLALWGRARLALRGLRFTPREEDQIDHGKLRAVDALYMATVGLSMVDSVRGAEVQDRHLLAALSAGEPSRLARALSLQAAFVAGESAGGARRAEQMLALAENLASTDLARAWVRGARGMVLFQGGSFAGAVLACGEAEAMVRELGGMRWHLTTLQMALLASLACSDLGDAPERMRRYLAEARECGDLFAIATLTTAAAGYVRLVDDEPEDFRLELRAAVEHWSPKTFDLQRLAQLVCETMIDLYRGEPSSARRRMREMAPVVLSSGLLRSSVQRLAYLSARGRSSVALGSAQTSPECEPALRDAEGDARRIARMPLLHAPHLADLLRAGVARRKGDHPQAAARLASAEAGLAEAGMTLHAQCARRALGRLKGGGEGTALVAAADAWLIAHGVKMPKRFAAMLVPGF